MKTFDFQDQNQQNSIIGEINNQPSIIMQKKEDPQQPVKKSMYTDIIEQPASKGLRFRYECEGRSAGCIPGTNTTNENKTYPTIKVVGYKGRAVVVVSCVTVEPPYRPHPHSLVGKEGCKKGVCTLELDPSTMTCCFSSLGIQCVKRKEIEAALQLRQQIRVDPFQTGFAHKDNQQSIDLNCVRLCFQVFLEGTEKGAFTFALRPVVSDPIYDKKSRSDLTICRMTECSASVTGGKEIMLFCDKVSKDDIQVQFYEETSDGAVTWRALGEFQPTDVHKQYGICFRTPKYKLMEVSQSVKANIQLYRPSDGATSLPRNFYFLPIEGPSHSKPKRLKTEITEMLLDKRHLTAKVLNGGGAADPSPPSLFYIGNPNGMPTTMSPGVIAMQSPTPSSLSATNIGSNFSAPFTNPLATLTTPIKFEPSSPIQNSVASHGNNNQVPVVPPPGGIQNIYQIDPSSKPQGLPQSLPMQLVQTTVNPNGSSNVATIHQPIQHQGQPHIQPSQHSNPQPTSKVCPNTTISIAATNNWSTELSEAKPNSNNDTTQIPLESMQQESIDNKEVMSDVASPGTDIDIGELYDDVMQCVYDDVQADGESIDLLFDKPPTPPERIRSSMIEPNCILPEVIERPLPEKPASKPSMMARFGKRGFLSGKGKDKKEAKKKQENEDDQNSNAKDVANTRNISGDSSTDNTSNKANMSKNGSVPFFQRLFNRSKSQTEEELNFQNQRNSVIMSDSNINDIVPSIPCHVDENGVISDKANIGNNETIIVNQNDSSISNENAIFELLDEQLGVNQIQA